MAIELDKAEWQQLMNGDVIIVDAKNNEGVDGIIGFFVAEASTEKIWDIFIDYNKFRTTFKGIKDLKVLHEDHNSAEVWFAIKAVFKFQYTLRRNYEIPGKRLTWEKLSGDFKVISGRWEIQPTADVERQLVIYESYVDIGFLVPAKLVRNAAAKEFSETVTRIRQRLLED
jgi:ribosome-associated toxin RatA of RatAB toxin-antitoxin module